MCDCLPFSVCSGLMTCPGCILPFALWEGRQDQAAPDHKLDKQLRNWVDAQISWFIRKVPDSRCWAWKQHPHPPSVFPPHKPHCSFCQCTAAIFDQGCNVAVSVIDGCILLICWNKASCGEMWHKPSYPKLQPFKAKPLRLNACLSLMIFVS